MTEYEWGSYKGHLSHLFPKGEDCVQSLCGKGYSGDSGRFGPTKRRRCKFCVEEEMLNNGSLKFMNLNGR